MLTKNRKYNYTGKLTLSRSCVLNENYQPKDDNVNWLFLKVGEQQFSFVYNIITPFNAKYGEAFEIEMAFTMIEVVKGVIKLNNTYEVFRGQEFIGFVNIDGVR